jgi:hypothetical protein
MIKFIKKLLGFKEKIEEKPVEKKKRTIKVIRFKSETFNVKKAIIEVNFTDGTSISTAHYGFVDQFIIDNRHGSYSTMYRPENSSVGTIAIVDAESVAQGIISRLDGNSIQTFRNDPYTQNISMAGVPKSMKLLSVEDFNQEHNVAYLVDEEIDD